MNTPQLTSEDLFDASICEGVAEGICILLRNNHIIYAGKIKDCPDTSGYLLLLHPADFELLRDHVAKRKH